MLSKCVLLFALLTYSLLKDITLCLLYNFIWYMWYIPLELIISLPCRSFHERCAYLPIVNHFRAIFTFSPNTLTSKTAEKTTVNIKQKYLFIASNVLLITYVNLFVVLSFNLACVLRVIFQYNTITMSPLL